jgi:hypothetical protein
MHLSAVYSFAAMLPFALAIPAFEKVFDATVTLDLNARSSVAVPGGTKLGTFAFRKL